MTENSSINSLFPISEEKGAYSEAKTEDILEALNNTEIDPEKLHSYMDPKVTPSQDLDKSMNSSMRTLIWKVGQMTNKTPASQKAPEGMEIWGEVIRLGVAARYINGVSEGKYNPGENTHPFLGSGWDIDEKRASEIAKTVKSQIETAKAVLNKEDVDLPKDEIEAMPLIMAACYLKTESLLEGN